MKRSFAGALIAAIVATSAVFQTAPAAAAPAVKIIAGPSGGHIAITRSNAGTPLAALHDAGRAFGGYFGRTPVIQSIVASTDGHAMYATFRSGAGSAPVVGIILAAAARNGTQLVAIADKSNRIRTSFAPMLTMLQGNTPQAGAGTPAPLHPYLFTDRSGSVSLADGWQVQTGAQGQLIAGNPNGEAALLGVGPLIVDPRAGLQARVAQSNGGLVLPYSPDPRIVYAEFASAIGRRSGVVPNVHFTFAKQVPSNSMNTMVVRAIENGKHGPETVMGAIGVSPMQMGGYTMYMQIMVVPNSRLSSDMATVLAMYNSYHVNTGVRAAQVQASQRYDEAFSSASIANINATGAASIANARAADAAMDRSTSGFVHYLNGTDVVENLNTGARGSVGEDWAQSMARENPQNFRIVPMTEYQAGN